MKIPITNYKNNETKLWLLDNTQTSLKDALWKDKVYNTLILMRSSNFFAQKKIVWNYKDFQGIINFPSWSKFQTFEHFILSLIYWSWISSLF